MKEAFIILLVVCVLAALTAVKYRKQIAGMIGFARILKEARQSVGQQSNSFPVESIPLVNCSKCGVWVPQNKARKVGDIFYCSDECVQMQKPAR